MRFAALIVCVALAGISTRAARASVLYASANAAPGTTNLENIYTINQLSGASTLLGNSGIAAPLDLTSDWRPGSFRMWANNTVTNQLFSIDPDTGVATLVGGFGTAAEMYAIAFNAATGKLYGTTTFDQLYEINPDTAASSFIGNVTQPGILALGFDLSGVLYGYSDDTGQLVTIKTDTAVASAFGAPGVGTITDLAARPEDGAMFAISSVTDSIYTVDTSTGAATLVGPHGGGVDFMVGLAFSPIPEPATLALLALGGLGLMRRRRS